MDVIDVYKTFHSKAAEYTFSSSTQVTFSKTNHKTNFNKFKAEIIISIFPNHNTTSTCSYGNLLEGQEQRDTPGRCCALSPQAGGELRHSAVLPLRRDGQDDWWKYLLRPKTAGGCSAAPPLAGNAGELTGSRALLWPAEAMSAGGCDTPHAPAAVASTSLGTTPLLA